MTASPHATPKRLVAFDMDHTLTHAPTTESWYDFLGKKKIIDAQERHKRRYENNRRFLNGTMTGEQFSEVCFVELLGLSEAQVDALVEEWAAESDLVFPAARPVVASHLERGDLCFVVSTSFEKLARAIAREVSIPHFIGAIAELDSSNGCTGRQIGIAAYGMGKVARLDMALAELGVARKDFGEFWAYSDSPHDLPLLEAASHPVAANPDEDLEPVAIARKWPILKFGDFTK
jgi:HAD superfamily hydrolase (TIGR01490 family)